MALNFSLPKFGLGCAPLGGDGGVFGMESEAASDLLVQHSLAHGVTFFDTAGLYGAGLSERRLGHALAGVPRQRFQIATKIGVLINPDGSSERSYRRDAVKRSIDDSLSRLGLDFLEIAHIHDADSDENFRTALDEAHPVLSDLKAQGGDPGDWRGDEPVAAGGGVCPQRRLRLFSAGGALHSAGAGADQRVLAPLSGEEYPCLSGRRLQYGDPGDGQHPRRLVSIPPGPARNRGKDPAHRGDLRPAWGGTEGGCPAIPPGASGHP